MLIVSIDMGLFLYFNELLKYNVSENIILVIKAEMYLEGPRSSNYMF